MNKAILWTLSALGFYLTILYRKLTAFADAPDWQNFSFWYFTVCVFISLTNPKNIKYRLKVLPIFLLLIVFLVKQHFDAPRNFIISVIVSYLGFLLLFLQKDFIKGNKIFSLYKNILLLNVGYIFYEHLLIQSFFGNSSVVDKFARGVTVTPFMISLLSIEPIRINNVANEGIIFFPQSLSYEPQSVSTLSCLVVLASICIWKVKKELKVLIFCILCVALCILNMTTTTFIVLNTVLVIYLCFKFVKVFRNKWFLCILAILFMAFCYASQNIIFSLFGRSTGYSSEMSSRALYFDGFIRWADSGFNNLFFGTIQKNNLFGTELFPLNIIIEFGLLLTSIFLLINLKRFISFLKHLHAGNMSLFSFFWLSQLLLILTTSIHYGAMFYCSIWPLFVISLFECCRIFSEKTKFYFSKPDKVLIRR